MATSTARRFFYGVAFYWCAFFNLLLYLFLFLKNGAYTQRESDKDKSQYAIGSSPSWSHGDMETSRGKDSRSNGFRTQC